MVHPCQIALVAAVLAAAVVGYRSWFGIVHGDAHHLMSYEI